MSMTLLDLTERLVPISDFSQGKAGKIFNDVAENNKEYIVLKNNQPTAVLLSVKEYRDTQEKIAKLEAFLEKIENMRLLKLAEDDEKLNDSLCKADAIFPGSNLKISDEEMEEDKEDTCNINEKFIEEIANDSEIDKLSVMVMTNDSGLVDLCEERINNSFENFEYAGQYLFADEIDDDLVINDINATLPDILLCSFD